MAKYTFPSLMSALLHDMRMPPPSGAPQSVCTVQFIGKPDIHFVNHVPEFVDLICEAGILPATGSASLCRNLLIMNSLSGMLWPCGITLHEKDDTIAVWFRYPLGELDVPVLRAAIQGMYDKISVVQKQLSLNSGRSGVKASATSATTARIAVLNRNATA